METNT